MSTPDQSPVPFAIAALLAANKSGLLGPEPHQSLLGEALIQQRSPDPTSNYLGMGLLDLITPKQNEPGCSGGLGGLFANLPAAGAYARAPSSVVGSAEAISFGSTTAAKARRVFYSFHYRDIFRVNHVRKSDQIRGVDTGRQLTPADRSLWEKIKRTNPMALRRMIDSRVHGTSVTCVLAGFETWSREWVRYEIARSLIRGNGLLTVYIDGCRCPNEGTSAKGYDPLAQMALGWDMRIYEWRNGEFHLYDKIVEKLTTWPKWLSRPSEGRVTPLSQGTCSYDWIADDGFNNLIRWSDAAALQAER